MKNSLRLSALLVLALLFIPFSVALAVPVTEDRPERTRGQEARDVAPTNQRAEETPAGEEQDIGEFVRERAKNIQNKDAAERVRIKAEITIRVRERLEAVIRKAIERYEKVMAQVMNSNLTEEEKGVIIFQLEGQIAKLNGLLVEIEDIRDIAGLRAVMEKVRTDFKVSLGLVRQMIKDVYADRLTNVVDKLERAHTKLSERVEMLPEGTQKDELKLLLEKTELQIVEAEEKIGGNNFFEARETLNAVRNVLFQVAEVIRNLNRQ